MIDVERLCRGCMRQMENWQQICPRCGFDQKQELKRSAKCLPEETILNGRYLLGRVLGEGGFGITYLALDLVLETPVAVKEYFPVGLASRDVENTALEQVQVFQGEQGMYYRRGLENFAQEGRNLAQFHDLPGIVTARDFFFANETAYLVMDYVEGRSLKQYMQWYQQNSPGHAPMDYQVALALLEPVMKSLAQVHKAGLIHRDISPDNILVDSKGTVTLIDFGAARADLGNEFQSMTVMVKHGYAPEEQYRTHGKQGPWTDVYALCATLYHMISGVLPMDAVERLCEDELKPLKRLRLPVSVPEGISDVIERGMALRGKDRCQTMEELYQGLKLAQEEEEHREAEQRRKEAEAEEQQRREIQQKQREAAKKREQEEAERIQREAAKKQKEVEEAEQARRKAEAEAALAEVMQKKAEYAEEQRQKKETEDRKRQEELEKKRKKEQAEREKRERELQEKEAQEKLRRKKNTRKKIFAGILLAGAAFVLYAAGVYVKDQKEQAASTAWLTDYLGLGSYVDGDSHYILSREEVAQIEVRKDAYGELPPELSEESAGQRSDADWLREFVTENAESWKGERQEKADAAYVCGQAVPVFSCTRLEYRWLYPSGNTTGFSQEDWNLDWTPENVHNLYGDYFFDTMSDAGAISTRFAVPNEEYVIGGDVADGKKTIRYAGDELLMVSDGERAGYVTEEGETFIPFLFEKAGVFSDGLAPVSFRRMYTDRNGSRWGAQQHGYINKKGELAIPSLFDYTAPFSNGLAAVSFYSREGKLYWGYVDTEGSLRMVFRPEAFGMMYYEAFYKGTPPAPCSVDGTVAVGWRQMGNTDEMEMLEERTSLSRQQEELWKSPKEKDRDESEVYEARYGSKYVQGGWYLFDRNGKLVKTFDANYDVSTFLPCGLALVHDVSEMNQLWLNGSSDYEDFCKKMSARGGNAVPVTAWYINTKGEQVGEWMKLDFPKLAEVEAQIFGWPAEQYHYDWLKENAKETVSETENEGAASGKKEEDADRTGADAAITDWRDESFGVYPDGELSEDSFDTYLGTICIEMLKGNVAMAINPDGQLMDARTVTEEEELYGNPKAFLMYVLMAAMTGEADAEHCEEEDIEGVVQHLVERGYLDRDGDGYRETPEGEKLALDLRYFPEGGIGGEDKIVSRILNNRFAIKINSFQLSKHLSEGKSSWWEMIEDWRVPGKENYVEDAVFLPMPRKEADYNEMMASAEELGISVIAFPSYDTENAGAEENDSRQEAKTETEAETEDAYWENLPEETEEIDADALNQDFLTAMEEGRCRILVNRKGAWGVPDADYEENRQKMLEQGVQNVLANSGIRVELWRVLIGAINATHTSWEEEDIKFMNAYLDEAGYLDVNQDGFRETPEGEEACLDTLHVIGYEVGQECEAYCTLLMSKLSLLLSELQMNAYVGLEPIAQSSLSEFLRGDDWDVLIVVNENLERDWEEVKTICEELGITILLDSLEESSPSVGVAETNTSVNLRSEPDTDGAILAPLPEHTPIIMYEINEEGTWAYVTTQDGMSGYIRAEYLSVLAE